MAAEEVELGAAHAGAFVCEACHMRRADVTFPCRHKFHSRCVFQWPCSSCPACQRAFGEEPGVDILPLDNWAPPGATLSASPAAADTRPLRSGRWNEPEAEFAGMLVQDFTEGTLPLAEGTKLGNFLCNLLMCSSTRLSKKLKSGKKYFRRKVQTGTAEAIQEHRDRQRKISEQEELFLLAVANFDGGVEIAKMLSEVMQTEWREQFIGHAHGCRQRIDNAWQWNSRNQQPAGPHLSHSAAHLQQQQQQRSRMPFHQVLLSQQRNSEKMPTPLEMSPHHPASPSSSQYHLPPMHPGAPPSMRLPIRGRFGGSSFAPPPPPPPGYAHPGEPHSPYSTGPLGHRNQPVGPLTSHMLGSGGAAGGGAFPSVYDKLPPGLNESDPTARSLGQNLFARPPYSGMSYGMIDPMARKFLGQDARDGERTGHFRAGDETHMARSPPSAEWHHGMAPLEFPTTSALNAGMHTRPISGSASTAPAPWHMHAAGHYDFGARPGNEWGMPQMAPMSGSPASPQSSVRSGFSGYQPTSLAPHAHGRSLLEERMSASPSPPLAPPRDDTAIFLHAASLLAKFEVRGIQDNTRDGWMQALPKVISYLGRLSKLSAVFLFSVETQTILYASAGIYTLLGEDPNDLVGANPITSGLIHPEDVNHFITTALDCCQRQRQVVMSHAMSRSSILPEFAADSLAAIKIRLRARDRRYTRRTCSLFATDHIIATLCTEDLARQGTPPELDDTSDPRKRKPSPVGVTSTHADSLGDEPPPSQATTTFSASSAPPKKRASRTGPIVAPTPNDQSGAIGPTPSLSASSSSISPPAEDFQGFFQPPTHLDHGTAPVQTRLFNAGIQQLLENLPFDAADIWIPQPGSSPTSITMIFGGAFTRSAMLADWGRLSAHAEYPHSSWLTNLVHQQHQVRWIENVQSMDPHAFGRGDGPARFGIRTAVAVPLPVVRKDLVSASVLVVYSQQALPPSEAIKRQLLETVSHWVGSRTAAAPVAPALDDPLGNGAGHRDDEQDGKEDDEFEDDPESRSGSSPTSSLAAPEHHITSSAAV